MKYNKYVVFVFLFGFLSAQDLGLYQKKYNEFSEVFVSKEDVFTFGFSKGNLDISSEHKSSEMILSDLNRVSYKDFFVTYDFKKLTDKKAETTSSKNKTFKVSNFKLVKNFSSSNSFHDDMNFVEFEYPGLEIGGMKHKYAKYAYSDPHLLSKVIFLENTPVDSYKLKLSVDNGIEIGYKVFNLPEDLRFSTVKNRNSTDFLWEADALLPLKIESDTKGYLHNAPHIVLYIKSYINKDNEKVNVLNNLDDLHKLYAGFLSKVENVASEELTSIVSQIIKPEDTELNKVKTIYNWVKTNIKYIAFEEGYEGFIPRSANSVLRNKYGDCKDMANLIFYMSKLSGIDNVHLTWLGTRSLPYSYLMLNTPDVDNHMIAAYQSGSEYIFLDATSQYTEFGMPSGFIQGKEGLVHIDDEKYEVVNIPVVESKSNRLFERIKLKIDEGVLIGESNFEAKGYPREEFLILSRNLNKEEREKDLKFFLTKGNNKFRLYDFEEKIVEGDVDSSIEANYNFSIDDYINSYQKDIYVNLFLAKPLQDDFISKKRAYTYSKQENRQIAYEISLDTTGYQVVGFPESVDYKNEFVSFKSSYKKGAKEIVLQFELDEHQLDIPVDKVSIYNEAIQKLSETYANSIILRRK